MRGGGGGKAASGRDAVPDDEKGRRFVKLATRFLLTTVAFVVVFSVFLGWTGLLVFSKAIHSLDSAVFSEEVNGLEWQAREQDRLSPEGKNGGGKDGRLKVLDKIRAGYGKQKDQGAFPFVVDGGGKVVIHPLEGEGKPLFDPDVLARIRQRKEGEIEFFYRGARQGCVFKTYEPWDWIICMTTPARNRDRTVLSFIGGVIGISLVLIAISIAVISLISRKYIRPIYSVIRRLETIAKGEASGVSQGDMPLERKDEIGMLARAVDSMIERLRCSTVSVEVLQREQKRFKDVAESSGEWFWEIDRQGRYTYSNPVVEKVLGYKPEEILGKFFYDFLVSDERERVKKKAFEIMAKKEMLLNVPNRNLRKDGREVVIETNGFPILGEKGELLGYRGVDRNVTESSEAVAKVFHAKKEWEDTFDSINDIITIHDLDGNILRANKAAQRMLGLTFQEILARKCYEVFHKKDCPPEGCPVCSARKTGKPEMAEFYEPSLGLWVEVNVFPRVDEKGDLIGITHIVRDITGHKKAEQALNAQFREQEQSHKIIMSMLDDNNQIRDDLEKKLTDLKQAQKMLIQSEKLASIGQLAAGVAHEINNPLGYVSSNLSTLEKYVNGIVEILRVLESLKIAVKEKDTEKAVRVQARIDELENKLDLSYVLNDLGNLIRESWEGTERIRRIVMGLKTFSRMDEDVRELVDLNRIMESVLNIVWNEIRYKAELEKEYGEIPLIECNSQQLGQVFINLLVNAAHAIKNKGVIRVATSSDGVFVYVGISDTGEGIPPEIMDKIFDPFFTTKPKEKGTGLGLSICSDIVRAHRGDIAVESTVGKGTKFTVKIPVAEKGNPPGAGSAS